MRFFKGVTHRALSLVSQLAPSLSTEVLSVLRSSAEAAVKQCTHGSTGRECGFVWSSSLAQDASVLMGAGEQMSALAAVSGLLVAEAKAPLKIGQSNGQTQPSGKPSQTTGKPAASETKPSAGARSGVNVLTALLVAGALIAWN
jgi:mannan endo-1,6-alpha-mannosidase